MADCTVTLDVGSGADAPVVRGSMKIHRLTMGDNGEYLVSTDSTTALLSYPFATVDLERGVAFSFEPVIPKGDTRYCQIPNTASANFSDLVDVVPVPPGPGLLGDPLVSGLVTNTGSDTYGAIVDIIGADPTVAAAAVAAVQGAGFDGAMAARQTATETKKARALRAFHVALASVSTTAVDTLFVPGDSIVAGAWASNWRNTFTSIFRAKMRRAIQPASVAGGAGYEFIGNTFLGGGPIGGATGTTAADSVNGLGRTALTMQPAATLVIQSTCTSVDIAYAKGGGSFTYTIDGGAASAPVSTAGTGHAKETISGLSAIAHTIVITISAGAAVTIEGVATYNGDETAGFRTWVGAHAGYAASDFVASTVWADSIPLVPNPKLVVVSIGSNDFYAGRTKAQAKADILSIIALLRTKITNPFSIVLMAYYDRPPGSAVVPWSTYVDMYNEIADADDDIALLDLGPIFGPLLNNTDDRGGLTTATPGDYVHPTDAGHALIGQALAEFVLPEGAPATGGAFNNTLDAVKPVSTPQATADLAASAGLPYTAVGNIGGALTFAALPIGNFSLTATGNLSLPLSGMPAVTAGRTARFFVRILQDGTGGRTFTPDAGMKRVGTFAIDTTATTGLALIEFFYDGISWWVFNRSDPAVGVTEAAAIAAVTGDQQPVFVSASFTGAITLSGFTLAAYGGYRLTLTGNVTFSATAKPVIAAGRTGSFWVAFVQDGTGSRTLTLNANVLTAGGVDPTLSTAAGAIDIAFFTWTGTELILDRFVKGAA